jgi:hypothetical protein
MKAPAAFEQKLPAVALPELDALLAGLQSIETFPCAFAAVQSSESRACLSGILYKTDLLNRFRYSAGRPHLFPCRFLPLFCPSLSVWLLVQIFAEHQRQARRYAPVLLHDAAVLGLWRACASTAFA